MVRTGSAPSNCGHYDGRPSIRCDEGNGRRRQQLNALLEHLRGEAHGDRLEIFHDWGCFPKLTRGLSHGDGLDINLNVNLGLINP